MPRAWEGSVRGARKLQGAASLHQRNRAETLERCYKPRYTMLLCGDVLAVIFIVFTTQKII